MPSGDGKFNTGQSPQEYYGNEDHALRIRALEGSYSDLNAQLAANTVQLEGLNDGVSRLASQIEDLHKVITTSVPALARDVEALQSAENARTAKRDKRRNFVGRYASGALIAISGAGVTKLAPFIWKYLHQ